MEQKTIDKHRETVEGLFPKLEMAGYRMETQGRGHTIINITGQECLTLTLALQLYQRWLNDKEGQT